jgi:hypothetical protein
MTQTIRDAGFTPVLEDVRLTVTGALQAREGRYFLTLDRMKEARELPCLVPRAGDPHDRRLAESVGRAVEIHGRWLFEGQGGLEVDTVEATPPARREASEGD